MVLRQPSRLIQLTGSSAEQDSLKNMGAIHQALLGIGAGGVAGSPSGSEIIITSNAEIEAINSDIVNFSGGSFASGVTGAHGRVFDNGTFFASFTNPGGEEEFISAGCRFYFRTDSTDSILKFRTSASANHIQAQRVAGGTLRIADAGNSVNYDSGSANISLTTWYYVTLYARINSSVGEFIAKLYDASGTLVETLTQTGIDTQTGSSLFAAITVWGGTSGDTYTDHLWVDISGTFRGCGYVETRSPTSNGDTNSWSRGGTDTGNNWDQVNETPKDTTSYVFSTGADQVDLYNFQDRSQVGTPITVQQVTYARAHTAGTRQYKPICKIGGTIYEGDTVSVTSTSSDTAAVYNWQNNPATGNAWTDSDIDGAQFGVKSVTTDVRIQTVALQILVSI
jgi:hypothetical protein